MTTIHIGENTGATSKAPQLEEANEGVSFLPEEEMVVGSTLSVSSVPAGQEEASSSKPIVDASPANTDKEKDITDEGNESGSDMHLGDLKMIDKELTQIEVRMEGGSRTITILMDLDLLRNTKAVVPVLGPLCSEV